MSEAMRFRTGPHRAALAWLGVCCLWLAGGGSLHAQEAEADLVNYAYATVFGTGVYRVESSQATVFRIPFSYRWREMESVSRPGIEILAPVTLGYYDFDLDFDNIVGGDLPKDVATMSFVPGVSVEYPLLPRWRVKPYVQVGPGVSYPSGRRAWIYIAGVSSLYRIPTGNDVRLSLGNSAFYAGYDPDESRAEGLASATTALDLVLPQHFEFHGQDVHPGGFVAWYAYFNELTFDTGTGGAARIDNEYELGLTLTAETPFSVFGLKVSRLGLAYRYSQDLDAWRLVGEFPF